MFSFTLPDLIRILVVGVAAYITIIVFLRISGKRTLSKMNAFDLVITVALGSTLATILLDKNISLIEGMLALFLLVFLQFSVAWLSVRFSFVTKTIKAKPKLLYFDNRFLWDEMKKERIIEAEIYQAARTKGFSAMADIEAVILETDGSISVLGKTNRNAAASTLENVK